MFLGFRLKVDRCAKNIVKVYRAYDTIWLTSGGTYNKKYLFRMESRMKSLIKSAHFHPPRTEISTEDVKPRSSGGAEWQLHWECF